MTARCVSRDAPKGKFGVGSGPIDQVGAAATGNQQYLNSDQIEAVTPGWLRGDGVCESRRANLAGEPEGSIFELLFGVQKLNADQGAQFRSR